MNETSCRTLVAARSLGLCEIRIPGVCTGQAASKHHRRKVSQGGRWTAANVLDACGDGTTGCHGWVEAHPDAAREFGLWLFAGEEPQVTPVFCTYCGQPGWYRLGDDGSVTPVAMDTSPGQAG